MRDTCRRVLLALEPTGVYLIPDQPRRQTASTDYCEVPHVGFREWVNAKHLLQVEPEDAGGCYTLRTVLRHG